MCMQLDGEKDECMMSRMSKHNENYITEIILIICVILQTS
jgi:hypothetical protein